MAGQLVSVAGSWMQNVGESWLAYRLTHSAFLLGLFAFAGRIPVLFLGPVAGVVADRMNRHRLVCATQALLMAQAFLLAWMTLSGRIQAWQLVVFNATVGSLNAFDTPARQSFLAELVGRADLGNAIALNSSVFNFARFLGPALAGLVIASVGEGMCFLLNGVSFLAVLGSLYAMRIERRPAPPKGGSSLAYLRAGFAYVARTSAAREALLLLGTLSLAGMPALTFLPIFSGEILHLGAGGFGALMAAAGCGALVAALGLAARGGIRGLGRMLVAASAVFGVALVNCAVSKWAPLSMLLMLLVGWGMMSATAGTNTLLQWMVPDALRGRIMSLFTVTFLGLSPIGSLLMGLLAAHTGAPLAVALGGSICIVASVLFARRLPVLRKQIRETVDVEMPFPPEPA